MYGPALFLVELFAHGLSHALELALRLGVVSLDQEGMEKPASPGQVLQALAYSKKKKECKTLNV